MKVIALQYEIVWENRRANFEKIRKLLEQSNIHGGGLCVLPELFASGFSMNVSRIAESEAKAQTRDFLSSLARRYEMFVVGGLAELTNSGLGKNLACAFNPEGRQIAEYCKLHPFSFAKEDEYYQSGEKIIAFKCNDFIACPFICYDLRFPEIFRRAVKEYSANLFVVIANWPASRREHWMTLLRSRAIENQAYVIGVNRTGKDVNHSYVGDSMIIGPEGQIIADAGANERVIQAEIDIETVNRWREKFPVLKDMRFV